MSASIVIGIFIGCAITTFIFSTAFVLGFKYDGKLIIRHDDAGEGPYMFLELDDYPDKKELEKKMYVILKVKKR